MFDVIIRILVCLYRWRLQAIPIEKGGGVFNGPHPQARSTGSQVNSVAVYQTSCSVSMKSASILANQQRATRLLGY